MKSEYQIPVSKIEKLTKEIARLNRRAAKLNAEPIALVLGEIYAQGYDAHHEAVAAGEAAEYFVTMRSVELAGVAPVLAGWAFVGVIEAMPLEAGGVEGMLHAVPGQTLPRELAARWGQCDHCQKMRPRNDVYVVRNDAGECKVVGSSCLKDFVGGNDPHAAAGLCEIWVRAGRLCEEAESCEGGPHQGDGIGTMRVLEMAACVIRKEGFLSKARAAERDLCPTARTVETRLNITRLARDYAEWVERYQTTAEDEMLAVAAREWAEAQLGSENDYLHNCAMAARGVAVGRRTMGLAVSLIAAYQRTLEAAEPAEGAHVGAVGERLTMPLKFVASRPTFGTYGLTTVCTYLTPHGSKLVWYASGEPDAALTAEGDAVEMTFTVKKHGDYRGEKQTIVTRVALPKVKATRRAGVQVLAIA